MAIVRMKKLRLMAARSEKECLLRELERFGCIEFSELDSSLAEAGLLRENGDAIGLKNLQNTLLHAISLLDRYSPEKKPLLSPKPQVDLNDLLDETRLSQAESEAEVINGLEEKMKRLTAEENRQSSLLESLKPWMELDLPLDTAATERSHGRRPRSIPRRADDPAPSPSDARPAPLLPRESTPWNRFHNRQ